MYEELGEVRKIGGEEVLSPKQVCSLLGVARSTLTHRTKGDSSFPKSFKISERKMYFKLNEVVAWIDHRMNGGVDNVGIHSIGVSK